jgi:hypothetical protein
MQRDNAFVYALVNTDNAMREFKFRIHGTGNPIQSEDLGGRFIGTLEATPFVWHVVFEDGS